MQQTFSHFAWNTLNPVSCGNNLTLIVKIDGVAIDTNHAWLGYDNMNYWIKATTNLGLAGTYLITTFITNGVVTIPLESFSIKLVNPCLWKSDGAAQTILAQSTTIFPSSW